MARLVPEVAIDIPVGTAFQYRNVGTLPLTLICVTTRPWPGDHEATRIDGIWAAAV